MLFITNSKLNYFYFSSCKLKFDNNLKHVGSTQAKIKRYKYMISLVWLLFFTFNLFNSSFICVFAFMGISTARREYRSRSVQPQSQRPPATSQSGPILDSGSTHGLVQRLSNSQLSFNTSIASIFSQVRTDAHTAALSC